MPLVSGFYQAAKSNYLKILGSCTKVSIALYPWLRYRWTLSFAIIVRYSKRCNTMFWKELTFLVIIPSIRNYPNWFLLIFVNFLYFLEILFGANFAPLLSTSASSKFGILPEDLILKKAHERFALSSHLILTGYFVKKHMIVIAFNYPFRFHVI